MSSFQKFILKAIDTFNFFRKKPLDEVFDVVGIVDNRTLICRDLSYLTVIELSGYKGDITIGELEDKSENIGEIIASIVSGGNHIVKVIVDKSSDASKKIIDDGLAGMRNNAQRLGINIGGVFDEIRDSNTQGTHVTRTKLLIYTLFNSGEFGASSGDYTRSILGSQVDHKCSRQLSRHTLAVNNLMTIMDRSYILSIADSYSFLQDTYADIHGEYSASKRLSVLKATETKIRENESYELSSYNIKSLSKRKTTSILLSSIFSRHKLGIAAPDSLSQQIMDMDVRESDSGVVIIGNRVFYPLGLVKFGKRINSFKQLIRSTNGISFRVSMTFTAPAKSQNPIDSAMLFLVSNFGVNKERAETEQVYKSISDKCAFSINFSVYRNKNSVIDPKTGNEVVDTTDLLNDAQRFNTQLGIWGEITAMPSRGDALEQVLATFQGFGSRHVIEPFFASCSDILKLSPISLSAILWREGSMLYQTNDSELFFVKQMDTKNMASEIITVVGGQGYGKSAHVSVMNMQFVFQPTASGQLPYLRVMDFGLSVSGSIFMVRDELPESRRHEIQYHEMVNSTEFAINYFDLPIGNRFPTSSHRDGCIAFVGVLTSSLENYPSHADMCSEAVRLLFEYYADTDNNPNVKRYRPDVPEIEEYLKHSDIDPHGMPWYQLADILAMRKEWYLASIAMRYAVPLVEDLVVIGSSDAFKKRFPDEHMGVPVHQLFTRSISSLRASIPMLSVPSRLDASQSPIFVVDMQNLIIDSDDRQTLEKNAVFFALTSRLLTRDYFTSLAEINQYNPSFRDYHEARIREIMLSPKRVGFEEFNRLSKVNTAMNYGNFLCLHSRKYGVSAIFSSQLPEALPPYAVKLATIRIYSGGLSEDVFQSDAGSLGVAPSDIKTILRLPKPTEHNGASYFVQYKFGDLGDNESAGIGYELKLKIGSLVRWAIATYQEDRVAINVLTKEVGSMGLALRLLAISYPQGTVRGRITEIQRMIDRGAYKSKNGNIVADIVEDIVSNYRHKGMQNL